MSYFYVSSYGHDIFLLFFNQCSDLFPKLEIMNILKVTNQCIRAGRVYFQVFDFFLFCCDMSIKPWPQLIQLYCATFKHTGA
jgi:hypothetical protein